MISRLTGRVIRANSQAAEVEAGGICYEVYVPAAAAPDVQRLEGNDVTMFTIHYLEGNPTMGSMFPRLVGFLSESDREFFSAFVKVRGVSMRRALRAMAVPIHQIAAAIEQGDVRTLSSLPEIGKKTAAQIVTDLRGKLDAFLAPTAGPTPLAELTEAQSLALDVLVGWGDRRADAQRWISAAVEADPSLATPDEIVRAAYRAKQHAST